MATFHENLKQSFKNFKNKYIGNVPSGVTLAQINADLTELEGKMSKALDTSTKTQVGTTQITTTKNGKLFAMYLSIDSPSECDILVNNTSIRINNGTMVEANPIVIEFDFKAGDTIKGSGNSYNNSGRGAYFMYYAD
jgi:hypothetical protein